MFYFAFAKALTHNKPAVVFSFAPPAGSQLHALAESEWSSLWAQGSPGRPRVVPLFPWPHQPGPRRSLLPVIPSLLIPPPTLSLSLHLWVHQAGRPLAPCPLPPSSTVLSASGTCVGIRWGHPLWPPVSLLYNPPVSASVRLLPLSLIPSGMTNLTGLFRLPRL